MPLRASNQVLWNVWSYKFYDMMLAIDKIYFLYEFCLFIISMDFNINTVGKQSVGPIIFVCMSYVTLFVLH